MKRMITGIMACALLAGTVPASRAADEKEGVVTERKENQQQRIGQGVQNGSLTPRETARIERQEARLNKEVRRDRKDGGGLTNRERAKIRRQQNKLSKEIYRQKHDRQSQK